MGKPSGKKKTVISSKSGEAFGKPAKPTKAFDEDTAVFIAMSQELRDEGNRLYQKRDHEGAMLKYEKALKLLPKNHIDVAYLRSNMAACYMQLGLGEYPRAINECNLALEVSPKYSKALLRRAKCYEALNRLDLALRDVNYVLSMEPSNVTALEIADSVKNTMIEKGIHVEDKEIVSEKVEREIVSEKVEKEIVSEKFETPVKEKAEISTNDNSSSQKKSSKERSGKKRRSTKVDGKKSKVKVVVEEKLNKTKDKEVVLKKKAIEEEEEEQQKEITKSVKEEHLSDTRKVKLVLGEDIRWAHLPVNCSIKLVRDIVMDRFPNLRGALVKYKDQEGDLVTITTNSELRMVEASGGHQGSLRLYIADVHSEQEPAYEGLEGEEELEKVNRNSKVSETVDKGSICVEDWIVQFARLFKNQVGFETDSYLDLHEIGMKLYSEAMEETITTEDSQQLFEIASEKFQEMTSLALFNWGNVHMSRVRKQVFIPDDHNSRDAILEKVKTAYTWALKEYGKAGSRYEEALKIKNDFYEALLALGQQQFEQAKLCWYYAVATNSNGIDDGPTEEILMLYNKAEDSMERGMQIWEEMEERRLNGISESDKYKVLLQKMDLDGVFKEVGADEEALEYGSNMRSQIYLLWGTLLYERSVVEYKLQLPTWEECLEVAVEKFELAGASATDRAVIIKNHCSNATSLEGFKIDEIVHAWNEMYDASKWQIGVPAFRLEPLFRRKVPKLHSVLEHI